MKKKSQSGGFASHLPIQIARIMRLTLLFIFFSLFSVSANVLSQITLEVENKTYKEVFREIENQTSYRFFFSDDIEALNEKVTIKKKDCSLENVLDTLTEENELHYAVLSNNAVIISPFETQEARKVTGTIVDEGGDTLVGVSILVKGTSRGAVSNIDGKYSIEATSGDILVFSYIGSQTKQITVGGQDVINVVLESDEKMLDEVIVTALGIVKTEKSLTYSAQALEGEELTRVKDPNMMNALAGKTAGVQISKSASGLGGSAKVNIRGNRSASGSNQPLYVIDGIPVSNNTSEQSVTTMGGTNDGANRDSGDGISNLNPDDIESMTILKGPAAAALYGAQAANGVVVIVTKKGKEGHTRVTFNSSNTFDVVAEIPELQNMYGEGFNSWGTNKISGGHDPKDFFKTGFTTINSVSLSSGNEFLQNYFSYGNTSASGIVEGNKLSKHNLNFRETATFFNKKLTADANINLLHQKIKDRTSPGGLYMNPLVGLYSFPRAADFNSYKENYQVMDPERNMYTQNWYISDDKNQNPYWLLYNAPNEDVRNRVMANISLKWKFNDKFSVQVRGNADYISDKFEQKYYAGTHTNISGTNGRLIHYEGTEMNLYGDAMATYTNKFNDFSLTAVLGASITDTDVNSLRLDSHRSTVGLFYPNVFDVANMDLNNGRIEQIEDHRQDQSIFATAQLGYKEILYLDLTARNDWSSTLAFTDHRKKGFFYPSVGLTGIVSEMVKLPDWWNYTKVRGAYSEVGNSLPMYITRRYHSIAAGGQLVPNTITVAPGTSLQPERTKSFEAGLELRFFDYRLDFDITYYKTNTKSQLFTIPAPAGSGFSHYYINAGDIQNSGLEMILGITPVKTQDFTWKTNFNYAMNKNKVVELAEELQFFPITQLGTDSYQMRLEKNGSFGDIYGRAFERDAAGKIVINENGVPSRLEDFVKIGNTTPDFNLGWSNTLTYKNWSLYFLIDGRFGGDVLSITEAENDLNGVSLTTGKAREAGFVMLEGHKYTNVEDFYKSIGGRAGISEYYMYDATNIRLREVSLGYSLPKSLLGNSFIDKIDLSFIARNLFFFYKDAPYDPDNQMSVGNGLQGVDVFGMPSTRSLGFNIKITL